MTSLPSPLTCAAALALIAPLAAHAAAQDQPSGTFSLPPTSPTDDRADIAIPPRTEPDAAPTMTSTPVIQPLPSPSASEQPTLPAPRRPAAADPAALQPAPGLPAPVLNAAAPDLPPLSPPGKLDDGVADAPPADGLAPEAPITASVLPDKAQPGPAANLPDWWPLAAGGLGAAVLLGTAIVAWRRRKPKVMRLAAPIAGAPAQAAAIPPERPRIDIAFEVTSATRSVMNFTLGWRITVVNRADTAISDLALAVQIACARASAAAGGAGHAPLPASAQHLAAIDRLGPSQSRSLAGEVQLPLSAIAPLRQGTTPLLIPLVNMTVESEGQRALAKSFVVGTPSAGGRVHPIPLDLPPGAIPGLVAQAIALSPASAAA